MRFGARLLPAALVPALLCTAGCWAAAREPNGCVSCHRSLEAASPTHTDCASCHGGQPAAREAGDALGMHDLASASHWEKSCGSCHRHQVERMKSSQMFTNAGMIGQIQATWEGDRDGITYAAQPGARHRPDGTPFDHARVADLDNLSGELYRKFCSRCHLARPNNALDPSGHAAGCAACHFPYEDDATYRGADTTVRGRTSASPTHTMQGLPPMRACASCHHRSGRAALAYQGLNDGNNSLVPTRHGLPGPVAGSDDRTFTHTAPDVHFEAGMECIDCHTSREIMGDGYSGVDMHDQLEIACEDCHGSGTRRPSLSAVVRESDAPVRESRQYVVRVAPGMRVAQTAGGRPYSNVFESPDGLVLATKRTGRMLRSPVITGTAAHTVVGHERMECSSCHSRAVAQCYGCHTKYDKRAADWDAIKEQDTPGAFTETEDYRTLYPFPLAIGPRGRIAPVTPGCQTFVTVVEADGTVSKDEYVARYKGKPQLRFSSFFGHATGRRAVGCAECHGNPTFLGFGQNVLENRSIRSTLLCEKNASKALDGFLSMQDGRIVSHAAVTRTGARPLDDSEVRRALAVNLCLICHPSPADPIYRRRLDFNALDDERHRRLLDAGR
jgi:hypothetical protein